MGQVNQGFIVLSFGFYVLIYIEMGMISIHIDEAQLAKVATNQCK